MRAARGWRNRQKQRALVTLVDGASLTGILWETVGPVVLRDTTLLADVGGAPLQSPTKLDGEVIIDFARIEWVQIAAAPAV